MDKNIDVVILETPEEDTDPIRFIIRNTTPAFANTLRRIMIAEVPTLAIEDVIFIENTTPLQDEFIAHRLGLIPITTDLSMLNFKDECSCGGAGCSLCTVSLTLEAETAEDETMVVYSRSLKSSDPILSPVSDKIPIIKMAPGQRLILEAIAELGRGKEHAKWQPVSTAAFQYMPEIEVQPRKTDPEIAEACPRGVLQYNEEEETIEVVDLFQCNLCMECVKAAKRVDDPDVISVKGSPEHIIMRIEPTGALPAEEIVFEAANILKERATNFLESLKNEITKKQEANE